MGEVYVYDPVQEKVVPKSEATPKGGLHIIRDTMDQTWHPSDGKHYDSKSRFRQVTKAHGGIEVGTEKQTQRPEYNRVSKADVAKAVEMVNQGYRPFVGRERLDG